MSEYPDNYAGGADEGMVEPMGNGGNSRNTVFEKKSS